jgi:hypothetical protein
MSLALAPVYARCLPRTRCHRSHRGHWDRPARPKLGFRPAAPSHGELRGGASPPPPWRYTAGGVARAAPGLSPCGCPGHVAACSRRGRDRLVNRPDLAGQRAPVGWSDADLICGQGTVAEDAAGPRPCPAGPTGGRVRWNRDAAPAWPCPPAWWVGRSLATRPRAVTPRERPEDAPARGDHYRARIRVREGPQLHVLAQARRPPSMHSADLRLALPSVPHPWAAVLQPRRPELSGARHWAAGGGVGPAVAGQGDDEGRHRPRRARR